jgi:putative transposase
MGYIKIWIHLVWTTKSREPVLTTDIRKQVFDHIRENAREKSIHIDFINGHLEHVHCLLSLGSGQNIDKILMLLKGESSHWINLTNICKGKFEWQDEYFAVSVSESGVDRVRAYIKNQEEHHRKRTFQEEYDEIMKKYGFDKFVSG